MQSTRSQLNATKCRLADVVAVVVVVVVGGG